MKSKKIVEIMEDGTRIDSGEPIKEHKGKQGKIHHRKDGKYNGNNSGKEN